VAILPRTFFDLLFIEMDWAAGVVRFYTMTDFDSFQYRNRQTSVGAAGLRLAVKYNSSG
jgi:hypothetical protein